MHKKILELIGVIGLLFIVFEVSAKPHKKGSKLPKPLTNADFYDNGAPSDENVILGNFLFYDKILSGNENISCATCHHSMANLWDGLSQPIGEGAAGLGMTRNTGIGDDAVHERVPRNAPPVISVGVKAFDTMFHDGRIQFDPTMPSEIDSPAGDDLPEGLDNVGRTSDVSRYFWS